MQHDNQANRHDATLEPRAEELRPTREDEAQRTPEARERPEPPPRRFYEF